MARPSPSLSLLPPPLPSLLGLSKVLGPGPVGGPRTEPLTPPLTALTHRRGPGRGLTEGPGVGGRGRPEPPHLLGGRREPDRASRVRSGFPPGLCRSSGLGKDLLGFLFVFAGKGRGRPQEGANPGLRAAAGGTGRGALAVNREV